MIPRRSAGGLLRDRSGSILVEFALIAPFLVCLLLAMFDLGPALLVRFKVAGATQTVADLVTQSSTMQAADVANYFGAGADVMAPFSSSPLTLRITNVASNGLGSLLGRAFVYWSCGQGTLPPYIATSTVSSTPTGTPVTDLLSLALSGMNTSYVMVETSYTFTPPAGFIIRTPQTITSTAYAMPRVSTYIGPTNGMFGYIPPLPNLTVLSYPTTLNGITCNTGL